MISSELEIIVKKYHNHVPSTKMKDLSKDVLIISFVKLYSENEWVTEEDLVPIKEVYIVYSTVFRKLYEYYEWEHIILDKYNNKTHFNLLLDELVTEGIVKKECHKTIWLKFLPMIF